MKDGLRFLLQGTFDYAGMFAPASLPFKQAIDKYCWGCREARRNGSLARFVCPADKLAELTVLDSHWPVSLVLSPRPKDSIVEEVRRIVRQVESLCPRPLVSSLELRLPPDADIERLVPDVARAAVSDVKNGTSKIGISFELPADSGIEMVERLARAVAANPSSEDPRRLQLKVRTGGTEAAAVPTSERLTCFLMACQAANVYWKATAGLHNPVRCFDPALGVLVHGFINLLMASVLAKALALTKSQVQELIEDQDPQSFAWLDDRVAWRNLSIPKGAALNGPMQSFGTCSVDEPMQHLRELGWI
jgi:hypothetical protein